MCGILGSWGPAQSTSWLVQNLELIKHRGPDHQGVLEIPSGPLMGVARLAMTDRHPRSNQPMTTQPSGNCLSLNGEIYNYVQLREKLIEQGISFSTESDTEVVLEWLSKYGVDGLRDFDGMFSLAFYCSSSNQLIIARDSKGKKPLYYRITRETIIWASEIGPLREKSNLLQKEGLIQYLSLGYTIDPLTLQAGITSVVPGEALIVTFNENEINIDRRDIRKVSNSLRAEPGDLRKAIESAVLTRVKDHNEVALSMSGGIDSTVIACVLHNHGIPFTGFSAAWEDSDKDRYNDDSLIASRIASQLSAPHRMVNMIDSGSLILQLDRMLEITGDPFGNPTALSMMRLYETIRQNKFRLVLTGDGADEYFAGYERYSAAAKIPSLFQLRGRFIEEFVLSNNVSSKKIQKITLTQLIPHSAASWLYWHQIFDPREIESLTKNTEPPFDVLRKALHIRDLGGQKLGSTGALMQGDQRIWLPMESNRRLDRASMGHSIEARCPFQDDRVIEIAGALMKKTNFKKLSKQILIREFPELKEFELQKKKTGFSSPVGHWLRSNKEEVAINIKSLSYTADFDLNVLNDYLSRPWEGDYKFLMKLWTLLVMSRWIHTLGQLND